MADKKVTQLTSQTNNSSEDLLMVVDNPNGTPVSKKQTIKAFFNYVPANTSFQANVTISGNKFLSAANGQFTKYLTANNIKLTIKSTPSTNNATTEGWVVGEMRCSNTYLYVAVNATTIRRVALGTF